MRGWVVVFLVGFTVWVVAAGLTIWWAIRLLRRVTDRTRRAVDRGLLSIKAHLAPGSSRRVAAAQLELRSGMERTRRVLEDALRRHCPLGDLPGLFRRIEHLAEAVDGELQILAGDRDGLQRTRLAAVLVRSEELVAMAAGIRRTVSGVRGEMQADGFELLRRDLAVELSAVAAGAAAVRSRAEPPRTAPVLPS